MSRRATVSQILENHESVTIKVQGEYIANRNRRLNSNEQPLSIYVEGDDEIAVKSAVNDVIRVLTETQQRYASSGHKSIQSNYNVFT